MSQDKCFFCSTVDVRRFPDTPETAEGDEGVGDGEGERQQADEVQRGAEEQQQQRRQRRRELEPLLIN